MSNTREAYICGIDFDYELEEASHNTIYSSIKGLKEQHICWESCGIYKVIVTLEEIIHETDLSFEEE